MENGGFCVMKYIIFNIGRVDTL